MYSLFRKGILQQPAVGWTVANLDHSNGCQFRSFQELPIQISSRQRTFSSILIQFTITEFQQNQSSVSYNLRQSTELITAFQTPR